MQIVPALKFTLGFALFCLGVLYLVNVAVNLAYRQTVQERLDVLERRLVELAAVDPSGAARGAVRRRLAEGDFNSFFTSVPAAIRRGEAVTAYLRAHPHVALGVAVDGAVGFGGGDGIDGDRARGGGDVGGGDGGGVGGLAPAAVQALLGRLNRALAAEGVTVGLAEPVVALALPARASWSDLRHGVRAGFAGPADLHVLLTARRCRYGGDGSDPGAARGGALAAAGDAGPVANRVYSFGRDGVSVVDAARIGPGSGDGAGAGAGDGNGAGGVAVDRASGGDDNDLVARLLLVIARHLAHESVKGRWRAADYGEAAAAVLARRAIEGRVRPAPRLPAPAPVADREVSVTVGLDGVTPEAARAAFAALARVYAPFRLGFRIRRLVAHPLADRWRWPEQIRALHAHGPADLLVLLSADRWVSPLQGPVLGMASAYVGALMVEAGDSPEETARRLAHETGHLFGLAHSFVPGSVMYPDAAGSGPAWSPGNARRMREGQRETAWRRQIVEKHLFARSIALAPVLRRGRRAPDGGGSGGGGDAAAGALDAWGAGRRGDIFLRCER